MFATYPSQRKLPGKSEAGLEITLGTKHVTLQQC
jgi:hypothetical protein